MWPWDARAPPGVDGGGRAPPVGRRGCSLAIGVERADDDVVVCDSESNHADRTQCRTCAVEFVRMSERVERFLASTAGRADDAQQHRHENDRPPHRGLEQRGVGMLLIADILIAVILAIGVGPDSHVEEPTLPRPTEGCHPALTIGHVQGRLDRLWIIGYAPAMSATSRGCGLHHRDAMTGTPAGTWARRRDEGGSGLSDDVRGLRGPRHGRGGVRRFGSIAVVGGTVAGVVAASRGWTVRPGVRSAAMGHPRR